MIALTDVTYRQTVGRAATALVGVGFSEQAIPDFEAKFELFREMTGMTARTWPDNIFAKFLFGEQPEASETAANSAIHFSRKKKGKVAFLPDDASALAQLMNYFAQFSTQELSNYQAGRFDDAAIEFIMTQVPANASLRANDLALPMLDFAGRLAVMMSAEDRVAYDILHDRAMSYLNGLRSVCDPRCGVMFSHSRERTVAVPRFGSAQRKPDLPPWAWEPLVFRAGATPLVGLDFVLEQPCELWAFTVRDPRPPASRERTGRHCWDESWANLVRWSVPPVRIDPGARLAIDYGMIVDKPGEYSIYLLNDVGATGSVRAALGLASESAVPVEALHLLLAAARNSRKPLGFGCYTRRYRVRGA